MQSALDAREQGLGLCLDFTDTVDWRTSNHAEDGLKTYEDLLAWSTKRGLVSKAYQTKLGSLVAGNQALGRKVMADAHELREAIYHIFSAIAHEKKADRKDIELMNTHLAKGLSKLSVRNTGEQYTWTWRDTNAADMMLWPIARSAADLLTSDELERVKECANEEEGCGSLFLDCSKSGTKKWCSMKSCGNRAKVRAWYERHERAHA